MDQSLALNALAPFLALAKSATSPRAAADLITQATSAPNTYVFAELLQQPNIQALQGNEQFGGSYQLLKIFAWGTWEDYKATPNLPALNDAQTLKLRLLSLLTIASSPQTTTSASTNLSYSSLASRLGLDSPIDLEHLVTQAIYSNLLTATLNPASQTVVITSISPLRDLAPGAVGTMIAELTAWSGRCESVLAELEAEIAKVKAGAVKRRREEVRVEKQTKSVLEAEKGPSQSAYSARMTRGMARGNDDDEDDDEMDVDGPGGKRRGNQGGSGLQGIIGRFSGRSGGR